MPGAWPWLALLCVAVLAAGVVEGHSPGCGHNAVRHRQERHLRKVLGAEYHREQQERRLQSLSLGSGPLTRLQKLLVKTEPAGMRVMPVYQLEAGYMTAQQAKQLKDVLMPGAVNVLHQYIKVRIPSFRPIRAVRESIDQYCGEADASVVFKGDGFNGTDQVYYITALNTGSCSDNIIAYTIICHMEPYTYRPNVAAINICPKFWSLSEPNSNKQVSALVHEMIHGLGFSDRMYPFLYDSSTGIQYDEVVREHQLAPAPPAAFRIPTLQIPSLPQIPTIGLPTLPGLPRFQADQNRGDTGSGGGSSSGASGGGSSSGSASSSGSQPHYEDAVDEAAALVEAAQRKVLFLVTPKLAAFAKEYYGCSSLPGAPADALSEGSHWRQANINHELMQPASAEDSQRKRISQFTLNFLDDTGWYVTDKSSAQELEWGRGAGCSFVLDGCSAYEGSHKHQTYYCGASQAGKDVCTYDSRGIGVCSAIPGSKCYTARADTNKPLLYCQDSKSFSKAARQAFSNSIAAVGGLVGSPSSRCFHTPQKICTGSSVDSRSNSSSATAAAAKQQEVCSGEDGSAVCMEAACDAQERLLVLLRLDGKDGKKEVVKLPCSDGATLDLPKLMPTKFKAGQIVCPSAASVCPTLGCTNACTNGYCWRGRCYCHMEFTGAGCSQSLVPQLKPTALMSLPASTTAEAGKRP